MLADFTPSFVGATMSSPQHLPEVPAAPVNGSKGKSTSYTLDSFLHDDGGEFRCAAGGRGSLHDLNRCV